MNLSPLPVQRFYSNVGIPLVGGKLFTYAAGTTTKIATYQDSSGTLNTNPIVLNFRGEANVWLDPALTYKFVLASPLDTDPPTNPIWSVDNISGALTILDVTQQFLGRILYPRTATEIALGVTPTNYYYAPTPRLDVRRYMSAWNDGSDQTAGFQAAINVAYADSGRVILPNGFNITCSGVSLTMSGNRGTQGFAIEGPGWNGAKITQTGSPTALLTIRGATPGSVPSEAPLVLQGFSLQGVGKTAHGITLDGIGYWKLLNVQVRGCLRGINLQSALVGTIDGCMSNENAYGLLASRSGGTGVGCNQIIVRGCMFNLNSTMGIQLESGGNWLLQGCDVEANGTSGNLNTGGMRITNTIDDEFSFAIVSLDGMWFEINLGQPLRVDSTSGLTLAIRDTLLLAGEGAREIVISGAAKVSIEDSFSPGGGGDLWDITCDQLFLKNVQVTTLTDASTYPTYHNVSTASGTQYLGRSEAVTLTLTGCTTSPTGSAIITQQGNEITIILPDLTATSNTTSCTLTGLPVKYRPTSGNVFIPAVVEDNSLDGAQYALLQTGSGTITLFKNGLTTGFTAAGTKGVRRSILKYTL